MIKHSKTFAVLFFACITLITSIVYYQPFAYLERIYHRHKAQEAIREGLKQRMGLPPSEYGRGMGYFVFNTPEKLKLHVPREYLSYKPNRPNGTQKSLLLSFFMPDIKTRYTAKQNNFQSSGKHPHIRLFLSPKNEYIECWEGRCLKPEFILFQLTLNDFKTNKKQKKSIHPLKDGQYDTFLNLIAYENINNTSKVSEPFESDTLYLKRGANYSCPEEWIHCKEYGCNQYWFRDCLYIQAHYSRDLLSHHAQIRKKIDQKLDAFIQRAT